MTPPSPVEVLTQARALVAAADGATDYATLDGLLDQVAAGKRDRNQVFGIRLCDLLDLREAARGLARALDLARQKGAGGDV